MTLGSLCNSPRVLGCNLEGGIPANCGDVTASTNCGRFLWVSLSSKSTTVEYVEGHMRALPPS